MPAPDLLEAALLCPACGFDLRGTTSDRCGECGLTVDRAALLHSGIPWAHRGHVGVVRAYFITLWRITFDRRSLRHEAAKPQELRDARAFGRITAGVVATALLAAFAAGLYVSGGWVSLAVQLNDPFALPRLGTRVEDAIVPWCAGAALYPVLPLGLILLALHLAGAQRFVFRAPGASTDHRRRAAALSLYATAPLAFLLPATGFLFAPVLLAARLADVLNEFSKPALAATIVGTALLFAGVLLALYRVGQWVARTRHCGFGRAALAVAELVALWVAGAAVLLGLLPWCAGLLWVAIDSLR